MADKRKERKAKKMLIKSGFISYFHFILDVMNGNRSSTNVRHETYTRSWGCKVLDDKLALLKMKYPKYKGYLDAVSCVYFNEISDLHQEVLTEIEVNIANELNENRDD